MAEKQNSILLAIIACVLWSTAAVGIKLGLPYTTPLRFAGLRFMIAGVMIYPFIKNKASEFRLVLKNWRRLLLISFFQTFLLYVLFYQGVARESASVTAIIIGAGPLVIAILAKISGLNEQFTIRKVVAILLGFVGIVVIAVARDSDGNENISLIGILLLIGANIAGGFGNVLVSKFKLPGSPLMKNSLQIFTGGVALFVVSLIVEPQSFTIKPIPYYISLSWLSFLSAAAFSLWFIVLQRDGVKVSEINIWKFIIPVLGATLSWVLIPDDQPSLSHLVGAVFVAVSLVLMNYNFKKRL